jgi:uncharacterized protein YigA (DUF484 family)
MRTEKVIIPLATFNRLSQVEVDAIRLREKIVELEKQIEDLKSDAQNDEWILEHGVWSRANS